MTKIRSILCLLPFILPGCIVPPGGALGLAEAPEFAALQREGYISKPSVQVSDRRFPVRVSPDGEWFVGAGANYQRCPDDNAKSCEAVAEEWLGARQSGPRLSEGEGGDHDH